MLWLIMIYFILISFIQNTYGKFTEVCYEVAGNAGKNFSVSFAKDISFIPQNFIVQFDIYDKTFLDGVTNSITFDAVKTNDLCSNSGLDHPNFPPIPGKGTHLEIRFYTYEFGYSIDHFKAYAGVGYQDTLTELEGLDGYAKLKIHYRTDIKRFPEYYRQDVKYFTKQRQIKDSEGLCITLFKKGEPIVFKIIGSELKNKIIYDYGDVYITYYIEYSQSDPLKYFSLSWFCDDEMGDRVTRFFVDKSVTKISVQIKQRDIDLTVKYVKTAEGFVQTSQSTSLTINPFKIVIKDPQTAFSHSDAILLFDTYKSKLECYQMDAYSYIEELLVNGVLVKRYGRIKEALDPSTNIIKLRPGTEQEINRCLGSLEK